MARFFTLNFHFKEKSYTALVSLRTIGYDLSCLVRYMDKEIHELIPGGKLEFSLSGEIASTVNLEYAPVRELLNCTSEAIAGYLRTEEAVESL